MEEAGRHVLPIGPFMERKQNETNRGKKIPAHGKVVKDAITITKTSTLIENKHKLVLNLFLFSIKYVYFHTVNK
jgi:hypothetical protein